MTDQSLDSALAAFRRLLADASAGEQAKVDALLALVQRTVFVATWPGQPDGFRTLVNADGDAALPMFTGLDELGVAANRFGWVESDGSVPHREVGSREALRHVVAQNLSFAVVDIASSHALEIARGEVEPLLTPAARRESSGPFAGVGRLSSTVMRAVRLTPSPGSIQKSDLQPSPRTPPAGLVVDAAGQVVPAPPSATFGSGSTVALHALRETPSDDLLDALSNVLRSYPEIEWAAFCSASRGPATPLPTIGLRVDTGFRSRVGEIIAAVRKTGTEQGASLDVLLLDDPELMRTARNEALVFYPWRRSR